MLDRAAACAITWSTRSSARRVRCAATCSSIATSCACPTSRSWRMRRGECGRGLSLKFQGWVRARVVSEVSGVGAGKGCLWSFRGECGRGLFLKFRGWVRARVVSEVSGVSEGEGCLWSFGVMMCCHFRSDEVDVFALEQHLLQQRRGTANDVDKRQSLDGDVRQRQATNLNSHNLTTSRIAGQTSSARAYSIATGVLRRWRQCWQWWRAGRPRGVQGWASAVETTCEILIFSLFTRVSTFKDLGKASLGFRELQSTHKRSLWIHHASSTMTLHVQTCSHQSHFACDYSLLVIICTSQLDQDASLGREPVAALEPGLAARRGPAANAGHGRVLDQAASAEWQEREGQTARGDHHIANDSFKRTH